MFARHCPAGEATVRSTMSLHTGSWWITVTPFETSHVDKGHLLPRKTQTGLKDVCARAEETARLTVLDQSFDGVATKTQVLKEDHTLSDGCE